MPANFVRTQLFDSTIINEQFRPCPMLSDKIRNNSDLELLSGVFGLLSVLFWSSSILYAFVLFGHNYLMVPYSIPDKGKLDFNVRHR